MLIHVCGQRGEWSSVEVPEGEVLELRETLRDLEDNTQAIRFQIGGEIPAPAPSPTPEAAEPADPTPES